MTNEYKLGQQLAHHEYLREQLAEKFPDADEETLCDTLEGMTDLTDMLAELIRSSLDDKALVTALKQREADMAERRVRFETRAEKKRDLAWSTMERADIKKIAMPDFTASLRKSQPAVSIADENEIPPRYWVRPDPKLDRAAINAALKAGVSVPGATLANAPPTLSVRTK